MEADKVMLSSTQFQILRITYICSQVNDMAYDLHDTFPKSKYYEKTPKKLWNLFWDDLIKWEHESRKYTNSDMLADYLCMVEDYVSADLEDLRLTYRREILRQGKPTPEDADILSAVQFVLNLFEYAKGNYKRMMEYKKEYVDPNTGKQELYRYDFAHLNIEFIYKRFSKFVDAFYSVVKCGDVNLHDSEIIKVSIRKFDDKLLSDKVQKEFLGIALGVEKQEPSEKERVVPIGLPFNIGRGRFKSVKFNSLTEVKCDKCIFRGRSACDMYNCDGVYFEKVV